MHTEFLRQLVDYGLKVHKEERREKFELSGYFRAELRTFTENFFKENSENFMSELKGIFNQGRWIIQLLVNIGREQLKTNIMLRHLISKQESKPKEEMKVLFDQVDKMSGEEHLKIITFLFERYKVGTDYLVEFEKHLIKKDVPN